MGTTKLKTERQLGTTEGMPVLARPSITSINSAVIGRLLAGMNSQGARPQMLL